MSRVPDAAAVRAAVEATDDVATTTYTWDRRGWLAGLTSASGTGTKHWSVRVDAFSSLILTGRRASMRLRIVSSFIVSTIAA